MAALRISLHLPPQLRNWFCCCHQSRSTSRSLAPNFSGAWALHWLPRLRHCHHLLPHTRREDGDGGADGRGGRREDEQRVAWVCKVQCTEALWISAYPYRANQFYACLVIPRYILPDKYISVLTLLSACFHSLTPWSTLFSHVIPLLIFANKFNTFIYNIILNNLYIIIN